MHAREFVILFLRPSGSRPLWESLLQRQEPTERQNLAQDICRRNVSSKTIIGQYCQHGRHKLCALPAQRKLKKATAILPAQDMCLKHEQPIWFLAFVFLLQPV